MSADPFAGEVLPDCPYQGLEPFHEADRAYFFGREVDIERIGANLVTAPLTIFYGASGVGKTSVLLAGVLPFVQKQPEVTAVVFRSWQGKEFERELKGELARVVATKSDVPLNVEQTLDRCLDDAARLTGGTLAVVFDQFEEYMLYHAPKSPEGRSFDTAFARAVNRSACDVNFLIGLREDALARLDRFRQHVPDLLTNRQQLIHLDERGAEEAIRKPIEHYNAVVRARNLPELSMEIEDGLVRKLIAQVRISGGTGRIEDGAVVRVETPFLQMVLQKLWDFERNAKSQVMREKTLRALGDAKQIGHDHVDAVMRTLSVAQRAAATAIFDRLVTPSRSKIAHTVADLVEYAGDDGAAVESLVQKLSDPHVRILRTVASSEGQTVRYEIFHDVLSEAVLAWRTKQLRDLKEAEKKRARIGCAIMLGVFLAIVLGGGWYLHKKDEDRERERNRLQKQAADAQVKLLQAMTERANTMGSAGVATGDLTLLQVALDGYKQLEDPAGQQRILGQIGALHASRQDYPRALEAYDEAIKLAPDDRSRRELQARRLVVVADQQAQQGEQKAAADAYLRAAEVAKQNGDTAMQAQVLTSAAVANQNVDLDAAERLWREALIIQRDRNDVDGQTKSLAGLATIEKQRKLVLEPTDTSPRESYSGPCDLDSMNGYWLQVDAKGRRSSKFIWKFESARVAWGANSGRHSASLVAQRLDGAVTGAFLLSDDQFSFTGTLEWVNGEIRKGVRLEMPVDQGSCSRVDTNQSFHFVRTKPPAASAY